MLALLAFGTSLLKHVPDAALGGILLFVALRIIRVKQIALIYRQSIWEFALILATAACIIALPIQQGAALGIILSLIHGIWSTMRAKLTTFERVPGTTIWWPASPPHLEMKGERLLGVAVVGQQAPLSFLNAPTFRSEVMKVVNDEKPSLLVLEASGMVEIDFTAAQVLIQLFGECHDQGVTVALARLESVRAQQAFEQFGSCRRCRGTTCSRRSDEAVRKLGKQG